MADKPHSVRVLYSYPYKLGADRICYTAWNQVRGVALAGAQVIACPGVLSRPLPECIDVRPTLSRGSLRIPYRILRGRAARLHDWIVSKRLEQWAGHIDIVHVWPSSSGQTIRTAARLGIPTVLERPNAHTRFAYQVVQKECDRLGVPMPPGHEHAYNPETLAREEDEFARASFLLCPSDFVARTFLELGFSAKKLLRHQYGYDESLYYPTLSSDLRPVPGRDGLSVLFVGGCAPRKGLHFALDAWLRSPAHQRGTFRIAGTFIPGYAEKLAAMLSHPSVEMLGQRTDIPDLMRASDILILPTIEEGSALVTSEARGSGCVLLISDAAGAICQHGIDSLVHRAGDVDTLAEHVTLLDRDRALLQKMRAASLATVQSLTWANAGVRLLQVYREALALHHRTQIGPQLGSS